MPEIEDIRVNGMAASSTTPIISGLHPVIVWDFLENVAAPSQISFELRIGDSAVENGTDEFPGNLADIVSPVSSNFYEYSLHNLARGIIYFGQIKAFDVDDDEGAWSTFSFKINTLPFVTNFSLNPTSPSASDDIDIVYTYNDADGHDQAGTKIRWFVNNLPAPDHDDLCILPSKATAPGESWNAKIIPSDGLEFGAIVETSAVTIAEITSSFTNIKILPTDANVDDILKVEFGIEEDEYIAITGIVSFEWFINGITVDDSNNQFVRLNVSVGDSVAVVISSKESDETLLSQAASDSITISDVDWYVFDLSINGLAESININDVEPALEWETHKTTALSGELPGFRRILITKTPSRSGPVFDSGNVEYTNNSFVISADVLSKGQTYYVHVGASDTSPVGDDRFTRKRFNILGSSWEENVSNSTGWTIEAKIQVTSGGLFNIDGSAITASNPPLDSELPRMGMYIHDGARFCAITFGQKKITFNSSASIEFDLDDNDVLPITDLLNFKTFKISGKGNDIKIFMDNVLIIDAVGAFVNESNLKFIEYGDIDGKLLNEGTFKFVRFTTTGAFGFGETITDENTFHFHEVGKIEGGEIQYVLDNLISWLPDDTDESAKLIQFNENSQDVRFDTTVKNFSPITSIFIDKDRNKYIGTANGVNAIYGEKHDPDYQFLTSDTNVVITTEDFDRITNVDTDKIGAVEPDVKTGWFTIDTTFRSIGVTDLTDRFATGDPYEPFKFGIDSHAIHYYSQRTHGHAWFDNVDNVKGWQLNFSLQLEFLEQDDFTEQNIQHQGFGIFINDGTYQEILLFYEDRIQLFYANIFVPIVTTAERNYRIVGKGKDLLIYQKLDVSSITAYQLLINGTGMFDTPVSTSGNSRRPRLTFDSEGLYHSAWHDDGNGRSQIFYSVHDGSTWSNPEIVAQSKFNLRNPDIEVDSTGKVWVVYEDTSWGKTEITVSTRDDSGWNPPVRVTNNKSDKAHPAITIDAFNDIHIVWEDNRNGPVQIFWARRRNDVQAWISSGQFGEDTVVMQQNDTNDPYVSGAVDFKNPELAYLHPRVWLVAEGRFDTGHVSVIYRGFRNVEEDSWQSIGAIQTNDDGEFTGEGASFISSPTTRNCLKPSIAVNDSNSVVVIVWEDQTQPVSQIWGSSYNSSGSEITAPTQITSRISDCKNPAAGFVTNQCAILFQSDDQIFLSNYDSDLFSFSGSNTGAGDTLLQFTDNRAVDNPAMASFVSSTTFKFVYDFLRIKDSSLDSVEFPDYYMIGDASILHTASSTSVTSTEITSNIDTKEFAFGDMSENIGLTAHWKDIKIYFGYDAKPANVGKFNSVTVPGWPDDRINDIFVDVFGNLIVATFGGLVYHNVFTGELTNIEAFAGSNLVSASLVTAVKWGGNGAWYVGTTGGGGAVAGLFISKDAGQSFEAFDALTLKTVHSIAIDSKGNAVCGTSDGVFIGNAIPEVNPASGVSSFIAEEVTSTSQNIRTKIKVPVRVVAVDDNDIIWAGTDTGLIRIENRSNFMFFDRKNGLSSNYITDIAIVNKHLRYVSTANGVNKMNGTVFSPINTTTHDIVNNNIAKIHWVSETQSLWVASLDTLHEIIFRDPHHEIIQDEIVQYDSSELLTESSFDKRDYIVLDKSNNDLITSESATVFINRNKIDFGFTVGERGNSIVFLTDMLTNDMVEIESSQRFIQFHDFNQTNIEKTVIGEKRTSITKMVRSNKSTATSTQLQTPPNLFISDLDKKSILSFVGESSLPFTTILLDRDLPLGCFRQTDTLTPTTLRFKIIAFDPDSGIDGYMLSNFENFTSDGDLPLDFKALPNDGMVTHNIGSDLNEISTSLTFPTTTTIGGVTITVGDGAALGSWTDVDDGRTRYLYAATNSPPIIWRLDHRTGEWTSIAQLSTDTNRVVTEMLEVENILFVATGDSTGVGEIYRTTNGLLFDRLAASNTSTHFNAIADTQDGIVYFGDNNGDIYEHRGDAVIKKFSAIGDTVNSMAVWQNILIATTGNNGRVFEINLDTSDNFIIFASADTSISQAHIRSAFSTRTAEETNLYIGSGSSTTIYRATMDNLDFVKTFSSFNKDINRIRSVEKVRTFNEENDGDQETTRTVAAIGDSLFKHRIPSWEFFFKHDEEIKDFLEHGTESSPGIYVISNSKVTKWTSVFATKTVYLRLKDKAGNISELPTKDGCPTEGSVTVGFDADNNPITEEEVFCCKFAYSLTIADLVNFVNESRIVDIDEYGKILFTFDVPNSDKSFYSADEIDQEIGIYVSEIFDGSNDIVAWKTITWVSTEPSGTTVNLQIRSSSSESTVTDQDWSSDLVKGSGGTVSIEHITDQYIQFRAILQSRTRDISPTLTSVTIRNLTTQASHFFTTNFVMPSRPIKGIITSNTFIPVTADIVFGISTKNSVDFGDYQIIENNRLFTTSQNQFGTDLRIGAKLISPAVPQLTSTNDPGDPYDASSFVCFVDFDYQNLDAIYKNFHFRIKFFNDPFRTQLAHNFFSGNDQTGWSFGSGDNVFAATGITIGSMDTQNVVFEPGDRVDTDQKWYVTIEAYDGTFFETVSDNQSYICAVCNISNEAALVSEYYKTGLPASMTQIPSFGSFTPDFTLLDIDIAFGETNADWITSKNQTLTGFDDNFAIRFRGKIQAGADGVYTFELTSNDGSRLFINAEEIIDHDGEHGFTAKQGTVTLDAGLHDIEVQFFNGTLSAGIELRWTTPGESTAVLVPAQSLFHAVANEYCDDTDSPKIFNFAVLFELEGGETVKLNLTP